MMNPPRKQGPVFQGLASPSLKKMKRMSRDELQLHIQTLKEHAATIQAKLDRQQRHLQPPSPQKAQAALRQLSRLEALATYAEELLHDQASTGYQRGNH